MTDCVRNVAIASCLETIVPIFGAVVVSDRFDVRVQIIAGTVVPRSAITLRLGLYILLDCIYV